MIITIDGPAGAGKTSTAKKLSETLGMTHLDTGALYRAITLKGMRLNLDWDDEDTWFAMATNARITVEAEKGRQRVLLDGEDVSEEIRMDAVTQGVRYVARMTHVRRIMVDVQRRMAEHKDIVGEGRDLGTVVFPEADYKFYLDADPKERLQRRAEEMKSKGETVHLQNLEDSMTERDQMDQTRTVSPLKPAKDSIVIDSTGMTVEQVVAKIIGMIKNGQ